MKTISMVLLAMVLVACGVKQEVTVSIVGVQRESTKWGCIDSGYITILETEDGYRDKWCGVWGEPGDQFTAVWVKHSLDPLNNGIKRQ